MNTQSEIEYIRCEYIKIGILNKNGTKTPSPHSFDYNIYPWEKGYIPKCGICNEMYNKYKMEPINEVKALHKNCKCLWFEWFKTKLLNIDANIKFK